MRVCQLATFGALWFHAKPLSRQHSTVFNFQDHVYNPYASLGLPLFRGWLTLFPLL